MEVAIPLSGIQSVKRRFVSSVWKSVIFNKSILYETDKIYSFDKIGDLQVHFRRFNQLTSRNLCKVPANDVLKGCCGG